VYKLADPGTISLTKSGVTFITALVIIGTLGTKITGMQWAAILLQVKLFKTPGIIVRRLTVRKQDLRTLYQPISSKERKFLPSIDICYSFVPGVSERYSRSL
jgi:hypothetical protein